VRLKLDENVPRSAKDVLEQFDHDCTTVVDEGLGGATDAQVAGAAAHEGRMLVTLDRGFGDIRAYPPGAHPGIVVVHATDQRAENVRRLLQRFLMTTDFADLERCTVIVEDNRVRVRHPRAE
jgi:predicted nuclease of predicted toxin-antitoxin system